MSITNLLNYLEVDCSPEELANLAPALNGHNALSDFLASHPDISQETVKRLLVMEVQGEQREYIVAKLVGRLTSLNRNILIEQITPCLKTKKPLKRKSVTTRAKTSASRTNGSARRKGASPTASSSRRKVKSSSSNSRGRKAANSRRSKRT